MRAQLPVAQAILPVRSHKQSQPFRTVLTFMRGLTASVRVELHVAQAILLAQLPVAQAILPVRSLKQPQPFRTVPASARDLLASARAQAAIAAATAQTTSVRERTDASTIAVLGSAREKAGWNSRLPSGLRW